jgi:DnaJ family protein C protein 7
MCGKNNSQYVALMANRSATLMMLERFQEVVDDCDVVLELDGKNTKILSRKARALLKLGELKTAEACFARMLETTPAESKSANLDGIKADAKAGLRSILAARSLVAKLHLLESISDLTSMGSVASELLSLCPYMHECRVLKAKALVSCKQYEEARQFIEEAICTTHFSLLQRHSHSKASHSEPVRSSLEWREDVSSGRISANFYSIVNFLLYMGSDLAALYLVSLKNIDLCKSCAASVISIVEVIIAELFNSTCDDAHWVWVRAVHSKLQQFVNAKQAADSAFKAGAYTESVRYYSDALKADEDALFWNSVLFCNRAAAYMALRMVRQSRTRFIYVSLITVSLPSFQHREALTDCHNSLARMPDYTKAYLRRARVFKVRQS